MPKFKIEKLMHSKPEKKNIGEKPVFHSIKH